MTIRFGSLALAALILPSLLVAAENSPEVLQAQGIARLERVHQQYLRTGIDASLLNQLDTAANELALSYRGFAAASKFAEASWSLVKLADCEVNAANFSRVAPNTQPQERTQRADTLARNARDHYKEAADLARRLKLNFYLVKALTGWARIEEEQFHDYGSANSHVAEAMRVASLCPDPQACNRIALEAKVNVETARGELYSAASRVNGLLSLLKHSSDPEMKYRAYLDRSSIYHAFSDGCSDSLERSEEVCYRLLDLSKADLVKASDIAAQAGFNQIVNIVRGQIQPGLDMDRTLTETNHSFKSSKIPANMFHPIAPKDVLVTEILPPGRLPLKTVEAVKALYNESGHLPGALDVYLQASFADFEGRPEAALELYLRAIQTVEEDRQKIGEDSARGSFLDDKVGYYRRPILMLLRNGRYAEAFDLIESTQARVTAELLSSKSLSLYRPMDRKLFAALAEKRAEVAKLQTHFFNGIFSSDPSGDDDPETVAKDQTHLTDLEEEYDQLVVRMARETPQTRDARNFPRAALEAVQDLLRQDSADLLYYYLEDSAVILIHVGPDSVHVRNIFLPRFVLKAKVAGLLESMSKQGIPFRDDLSKELFLYLIQPALPWLTTDRLIVIPQQELDSLPFQALEDPADGSFAGERFRISYAPSASILLQLKKQRNLAGGALLAAADPMLPGAAQEVSALARLYSAQKKVLADSLIRKTDLQKWAGSYDILHLAVHGKFDGDEPLLSYVELAAGPSEEGNLTAAEMFSLPLDHTRLVTLSACESGRVRTTRANDIQGIQQALLFAGAQSLLVSAWKVDSDATSLWMQTFYREAQTKTSADAAREAIRALRRNPAFSQPHFWAPFLLIAR